ncbi:MAG: leucine-rich repeat domain-containing protein [Clostridiales Family XIII bacterium]|jgi:hypothetical protein|nr:leucine-rich repeat domain-containing protein [Clostridiales Family XIII bacterium]
MTKRSEKNLGAKFLSMLLVVALAVALLWPLVIGRSFAADEDAAAEAEASVAAEEAETVDASVPEASEVLPAAEASSEEISALGVGGEFTFDGILYEVTAESGTTGEVKVAKPESGQYGTGSPIAIPETVVSGGKTYTVTSIADYAFQDFSGGTFYISSLVLPDTITSIGTSAFQGRTELTSDFIFPKNLKSIGNGAFSGCIGLTNVILPDGLTTIGARAFGNCWDENSFTGLESINIPASVTGINANAFRGDKNLKTIYFENPAPTGILTVDGAAFSSGALPAGSKKYVPIGTVAAYAAITGLTDFTEYGVELSVRKDDAAWDSSGKAPTIELGDDKYAVNYVPAGTDKIRYIYPALIADEADGNYGIFDGSIQIGSVGVSDGLGGGSNPVYANYYTVHYDNGSAAWTGLPIADEIYPNGATAVVEGISGLSTSVDREVIGWNLGAALKLQGNEITVNEPIEFVPALANKKQITYKIHDDDLALVSYTRLPEDTNWYSAGAYATVLGNTDLKLHGKRFVGWSDGTKTYKPGAKIKASGDVVLTAVFEEHIYTGKGGKDLDFGTFTGKETIRVAIDADIKNFEGLFIDDIDGEKLDSKFYTKKSGSTIITLKAAYLKSLGDDDYLFVAQFADGISDDISLTVDTASAGGGGNKPGGGDKPSGGDKPGGGGSAGGPALGNGGAGGAGGVTAGNSGGKGSAGSSGGKGGASGATKTGDSMDLMMLSIYTALSLLIILAIALPYRSQKFMHKTCESPRKSLYVS